MNKMILICAIFIVCISCNYDSSVRHALRLAGDNRAELEKVLEHYSQDATDLLKLRAAEFLIANMPGHYTIEGEEITWLREKIDNDTSGSFFSKKTLDVFMHFYMPNAGDSKKEDITTITSDFLTCHIDAVFEQYEQYPWLEDFPFDIFLEYILPYRFTQERLDYWRDSLQMDKSLLNKIEYYDDIKYLPSKIGYFTLPDIRSHNTNFLSSVFGTSIIGNCYYTSVKDLIKCRAMGIPAAIDFIPFYGNRNGYHGSETYITPEVHMPEKKYLTERKAPKIYRVTYSSNNMYEGKKDEYVPELFRDPFIRDVTDLYASTKDVSIPNLRRLDSRPDYAYLCVFNNLDWQPVAIGEYGRLVDFDKMGDDIIYLPVAYDKDERKTPLNYPFILYRNGKTEYLTPDTTTKQTIVLTRKYPGNMNINTMLRQLDASFWTASHSSDFADADTVFTYLASGYILDVEAKHGGDMPARRYWKFTQGNPSAMPAEFIFFGSDGEILKINADKPFDALFDGDPLTNTVIQNDLIIDLGKDTAVSKIVCIPRTDGNGIVPGNLYELLYHDLDGWKSLGKKIADDCIIKYDNVPAGALLWLHNHTTGIEERIFTAKNGEIRFW